MNDPVWYYARGESEKGPLTTAQIKALTKAGKIRASDLVWKESMPNWAPAKDVPELNLDSSGASVEVRPSIKATRRSEQDLVRPIGKLSLCVGLLVVTVSHGCQSLGEKHAARLQWAAQSSELVFQEQWQRERSRFESQKQTLSAKTNKTVAEQQELKAVTNSLAELENNMAIRERSLANGEWLQQRKAAREAINSNLIWGFWREAAFSVGTVILACGGLGLALSGEASERWLALAVLSAAVLGIYIAHGS